MSCDLSPGSTEAHVRARTREFHERAEALVDLPTLRTVERHRALLSTTPGEGSAFLFTLAVAGEA